MKPNQAKRQLRQIRERNKNNLSCNWLKTLIIVQIFRFTLRIRIFLVLPPTLELGKSLGWVGKQTIIGRRLRSASASISKNTEMQYSWKFEITLADGHYVLSRFKAQTAFFPGRTWGQRLHRGLTPVPPTTVCCCRLFWKTVWICFVVFLSLDFSTTEKPSSGASVFPRKLPKGKTTTARHSYLVSCWWWCHHPHPLQVPTGQYRRRGCKESRKQFPSQKPKRQHRAKLNIQLVVNCEKLYWY